MSTTERTQVTPDHNPVTLSSIVSIAAAIIVVVTIAFSSILLAVLVGAVAVVLFVLGLLAGYRLAIGFGTGLLMAGLVGAGTFLGTSTGLMLIGIIGTIVAWDIGENAINIGEQIGRNAPSTRAQAVHIVSTTAVGLFGAGIVYTVSNVVSGGKPLAALFFLLLGVIVAAWFIRN